MNAKKLISLVLALVLVLAISATAMAATVSNANTNHSFKAYQIFSGTQNASEGSLGNVSWGTGVDSNALLIELKKQTAFANCNDADDVANELAKYNSNSNEAKAFANIVANFLTANAVDIAASATNVTLDDGYYLIVDTTASLEAGDAYNSALLQITDTITIAVKHDTVSVDKKIVEDGTPKETGDYAIGDTVKFELIGDVVDMSDYDTYKYVFHDKLSSGLTLTPNTVKVYVRTIAADETYTDVEIAASNYTVTTPVATCAKNYEGCSIEVAFNNLKQVADAVAGTKIVVKYDATLNNNALIDAANPNEVKLEYSNDPNFDTDANNDGTPDSDKTPPTGITPPADVDVYTTQVNINKVDGDGNALTGATFKLEGTALNIVKTTTSTFTEATDGEYWKLNNGTYTKVDPNGEGVDDTVYADKVKKYAETVNTEYITESATVAVEKAVGTDGKLSFAGLMAGTYTLTETVTPGGYNTVAPIYLTVTFDETTETFTYAWSGGATGNSNTISVVNNLGSTLPETGGMGTTMLYIAGGLLVAAAAILLISKRRAGAAE